ncbi:MAG: MiaB/RimO family radical SAM methylthiotransferase [Oscillospiraceae bacterium]|nr:MiaB/RimO family radical SAM methylthiotransferase [Oscillospiraceae bacterium]
MRFLFETLGCRCNQSETAAMESLLRARGHSIVTENADVVVLNGCAVTAESARKSRQAARRLLKQNPGAKLAVCGCWPQAEPGEAEDCRPAVTGGSGSRLAFVEALCALEGDPPPVNLLDRALERRTFEALPPDRSLGRTRAYLKVEDGCVNFCAYCIIPFLRGPVRSLPPDQAVKEALRLRDSGVKELILTGIELASYQYGLGDLIAALGKAAPELRLRMGSLEPRVVDGDFCRKLREAPGLCPHFHLSLQSGCDDTLRRMGRKYDTARFRRSVELLREAYPDCAVTADLITGFPGETEQEFFRTLDFLRECAFAHVHVFPYSERKGTRAALMPDSVPKGEREERARRAIALASETRAAFLAAQVGTVQEVLFESRLGRTPNDCETELLPGREGQILPVRITGIREGRLTLGSPDLPVEAKA